MRIQSSRIWLLIVSAVCVLMWGPDTHAAPAPTLTIHPSLAIPWVGRTVTYAAVLTADGPGEKWTLILRLRGPDGVPRMVRQQSVTTDGTGRSSVTMQPETTSNITRVQVK